MLYPLLNHLPLNKNQISVVDIISVAYLKKFNNNLLFLTLDNNDYPLLDRVAVGAIDLKGDSLKDKGILTWGMYQFNEAKINGLQNNFNQ
ncbi:hypothetical protein KKC32_01665 [Patescibacteria group bacterium]|nr:hypothetical protein [Patescibacteria group bacterium]